MHDVLSACMHASSTESTLLKQLMHSYYLFTEFKWFFGENEI